jgi:hypothetical protein
VTDERLTGALEFTAGGLRWLASIEADPPREL